MTYASRHETITGMSTQLEDPIYRAAWLELTEHVAVIHPEVALYDLSVYQAEMEEGLLAKVVYHFLYLVQVLLDLTAVLAAIVLLICEWYEGRHGVDIQADAYLFLWVVTAGTAGSALGCALRRWDDRLDHRRCVTAWVSGLIDQWGDDEGDDE